MPVPEMVRVNLALSIVEHEFGLPYKQICQLLLRHDQLAIKLVCSQVDGTVNMDDKEVPFKEAAKTLCETLIYHGILWADEDKVSFNIQNTLLMVYQPIIIDRMQELYGEFGLNLMLAMFVEGRATTARLVKTAMDIRDESKVGDVDVGVERQMIEHIEVMKSKGYIINCTQWDKNTGLLLAQDEGESDFHTEESNNKRRRMNAHGAYESASLSMFTCDYHTCLQDWYSSRIVDYIGARMEEPQKEICRLILETGEGNVTRRTLTHNQLKEKVRSAAAEAATKGVPYPQIHEKVLSQYIRPLIDDTIKYFDRRRDSNRGAASESVYVIDKELLVRCVRKKRTRELIERKLNPVAARIFSIIIENRALEEEQVEELSTEQKKTVRTALLALRNAGFINVEEIARDPARQPNKSAYLYYVHPEELQSFLWTMFAESYTNEYYRFKHESKKAQTVLDSKLEDDYTVNRANLWTKLRGSFQSLLIQMAEMLLLFDNHTYLWGFEKELKLM